MIAAQTRRVCQQEKPARKNRQEKLVRKTGEEKLVGKNRCHPPRVHVRASSLQIMLRPTPRLTVRASPTIIRSWSGTRAPRSVRKKVPGRGLQDGARDRPFRYNRSRNPAASAGFLFAPSPAFCAL